MPATPRKPFRPAHALNLQEGYHDRAIALVNRLAELEGDKPTRVLDEFLREVLPKRIAKLEAKVKKEVTPT